MHLLWICLIGLIVGAIAKMLMPGDNPGGILATMIIGLAGAFLASFLGRALGLYPEGHAAGFFMSLIGAMVVLFIYHLATKKAA